ncbi:hypothetical protein GQ457_10G014710 [Hibiscus cannabinus]
MISCFMFTAYLLFFVFVYIEILHRSVFRFNHDHAGNSLWAQGIPLGRFLCFCAGNSLWTTIGSGASERVIPYGLLFRCFGTGNSLWTTVGFGASTWVPVLRHEYFLMNYYRFRCFGTGNSLWTTVASSASARIIPYGLL